MSLGLDNLYSRYVYRVLRPDEDPYENLTCKDFNSIRSIAQHVETGLTIPSQYISTTSSFETAKEWLKTANEKTSWIYGNKRTTIVQIDTYKIKSEYPQIANSAVDLTNYENLNYFLYNAAARRFAYTYKEVVFTYCIPSTAVSVVYNETAHYGRQQSSAFSSPQYYSPYYNNQMNNSLLMRGSSSPWIPSEETYSYRTYTDTSRSHSVYPRYQSGNNNPGEDIMGLVRVVCCLCIIVIAYIILIKQ